MTDSKSRLVAFAKIGALLGFLTLVYGTYSLRSQVLILSEIRFSADSVRAENDLERLESSYPERVQAYEMSLQQYELESQHYDDMLQLYKTDYDAYVKRIEDKYVVPRPPSAPSKPQPPEVSQQLQEINAQFRAAKHQYFEHSIWMNRIGSGAAMTLVGCLIFLLMFDIGCPRWHYLAALVISFVFLIGPAFHSILTGVIGGMTPPRM